MSRLVVLVVCGAFLLVAANAQEPDEPVAALTAQLEGKDPQARRRAAKDLGRRGGEQAIRALSQALGDDSEAVRHEAAVALARLAPDKPKLVEVLIASLRNEDWYMRWQACLALRSLGPRAEAAVPTLIRVLRDARLDNCREATLALSAIAPKKREVVDAFLRVLDAQHAVDWHAVIFALGRAGKTGRAVPWLAREVHSNKHGCREAARHLLERIAEDHADYFLMLFDPEEEGRIRAAGWFAGTAKTLHEWQEVVVPALVAALKDESWRVRWRVLEALGRIGKYANAKAAIPDIVRSTASTQRSERDAARQALETIAPSLARVIEIPAAEEKEADVLLALLTDPEVGDATLAALAQITGRTKEDLLKAARAGAAKK